MTDTTDIKALREALCKLKSVEGLRTLAAELIDQLEAERQRADKANLTCSDLLRTATDEAMRANKAEAELAALKGDQVPVGFIHHLDVAELKAGGDAEIKPHKTADWQIPMFTDPQKPVVLPSEVKELIAHIDDVLDNDAFERIDPKKWNAVTSLIAIGGIEAAGGTVKDGE